MYGAFDAGVADADDGVAVDIGATVTVTVGVMDSGVLTDVGTLVVPVGTSTTVVVESDSPLTERDMTLHPERITASSRVNTLVRPSVHWIRLICSPPMKIDVKMTGGLQDQCGSNPWQSHSLLLGQV